MKKLVFASVFILILSFLTSAQEENQPCPEIKIKGPNGVLFPEETVFFTATTNFEKQNIQYEWTVKTVKPEIGFGGQGTSMISIFTNKDLIDSNISVTVKIKGLPKNCNNTATEKFPVVNNVIGCGMPLDSFGKIAPPIKYAKIDNFLVALQNNPDAKGYVLFQVEETENPKSIKNNILDFFRHVKFRKFDTKQILFDVCESDIHRTAFWIVPEGAETPKPETCKEINIDLD